MILPFRLYESTVDWIHEDTKTIASTHTVFNLFLIQEWCNITNRTYGFNDTIKRTGILFQNGTFYKIRCPYEKFSKIMNDFLQEVGLLDLRTIEPKKFSCPIITEFKLSESEIIGSVYQKSNHLNKLTQYKINLN